MGNWFSSSTSAHDGAYSSERLRRIILAAPGGARDRIAAVSPTRDHERERPHIERLHAKNRTILRHASPKGPPMTAPIAITFMARRDTASRRSRSHRARGSRRSRGCLLHRYPRFEHADIGMTTARFANAGHHARNRSGRAPPRPRRRDRRDSDELILVDARDRCAKAAVSASERPVSTDERWMSPIGPAAAAYRSALSGGISGLLHSLLHNNLSATGVSFGESTASRIPAGDRLRGAAPSNAH